MPDLSPIRCAIVPTKAWNDIKIAWHDFQRSRERAGERVPGLGEARFHPAYQDAVYLDVPGNEGFPPELVKLLMALDTPKARVRLFPMVKDEEEQVLASSQRHPFNSGPEIWWQAYPPPRGWKALTLKEVFESEKWYGESTDIEALKEVGE